MGAQQGTVDAVRDCEIGVDVVVQGEALPLIASMPGGSSLVLRNRLCTSIKQQVPHTNAASRAVSDFVQAQL